MYLNQPWKGDTKPAHAKVTVAPSGLDPSATRIAGANAPGYARSPLGLTPQAMHGRLFEAEKANSQTRSLVHPQKTVRAGRYH